MKAKISYFHCGNQLRKTLMGEISEVEKVVDSIKWVPSFKHQRSESAYEHQAGYNKEFAKQFTELGWEPQPLLREKPRLIGDFRKGLVFIEIQFGNSSTLYRDYYKFQYGLANGLLSLAVLIVPIKPGIFFPTRPGSVASMADYNLAHTCLTILPINVPVLLIGLLPEN
jgi:hypothetical protein